MSSAIYAVYGAGGCGRGILPLAREMLREQKVSAGRLFFIDDKRTSHRINGQSVLKYEEFLAKEASARYAVIGISDSAIRELLAARLRTDGVIAWSVRASNAVVMDEVVIGEGAALSPFVTLTSNIRIGKHFQANLYSYIEHDCVIGDFVTFAPGVKCNGNVTIEDHAYIGAGAMIKQGTQNKPLVIGRSAVIGMGAVVTRDIPPGITVVGNPARPLVK